MGKPKLAALLDHLDEGAFRELPGADTFDLIVISQPDPDCVRREMAQADALWTSLKVPISREMLPQGGPLKVILTNSTGTDHLDVEAIAERGIELISLKNDHEFLRNVTPTAELAMGLLLACARRFPECFAATREGGWPRHQLAGSQLSGKTLGIIGVGRLGTLVAGYAMPFRMRVFGYDPHVEAMLSGVEKCGLDQLLAESDFISIHVHLSEGTAGMIGRAELSRMKPGVILINTSRGGLIDEAALIEAMESGIVAAAGVDVIDGEWLEDKYNHPLIAYSRKNPRLLITPHVGGTCSEAVWQTAAHSMKKLAVYFGRRLG